jgi:YYY domain-containing protein
MSAIFSWYVALGSLGWVAFPIAYRFLSKLPDRGFSLARPLALLIWPFIFWILSSFGLLRNDLSGVLLSLALLLGLSYYTLRFIDRSELMDWIKDNSRTIYVQEILFLVAFLLMAYLRSMNPGADSTEKPMELAFINSILQSPSMPPQDPWLSGFSISYYYFGFLMTSMLAQLTNTMGSIAFNMGLIMVFAMGAVGAYGLAHNLLSLMRPEKSQANRYAALLAPLFVLILGNLEGLLELMHAMHLFWTPDSSGSLTSGFWAWLDIKDLVNPPISEAVFQPRNFGSGSWWWWRASRVINDVTFSGFPQELIDEFPAFSFVLGDLHPHVLSIPFAFLTLNTGLNLYLGGGNSSKTPEIIGLHLGWQQIAFLGFVLGSLAFINIWDFPIYLVYISGAYLLRRVFKDGWAWDRAIDFLRVFAVLAFLGVILYLPYYIGFSSQAAGFLPNLLNPTRGVQLWVMFGTLFIPLFGFFIVDTRQSRSNGGLSRALFLSITFVLALVLFAFGLAWVLATLMPDSVLGQSILSGSGAPDLSSLFPEAFSRRLAASGGWISLILLLVFALRGILVNLKKPENKATSLPTFPFFFLLALFATLLIIAPEFVFLRDQFGTRMNTVFKFYYQAWLVLGVLAAVATTLWVDRLKGATKWLTKIGIGSVILAAAIYPVFAFSDRYSPEPDKRATLNSSSFLPPTVLAGITWLEEAPQGTLVEAVGGSYNTNFARYATHSGQSGVLGWPGHESQWRGGSAQFDGRAGDIEILYATQDWGRALEVIQRYEIRYVIVGSVERSTYNLDELKFQTHLELVFQNEELAIYQVP